MIRILLILVVAALMFAAGKFVFKDKEQNTFRVICYGLATFFSALFIYVMALSLFSSEPI